MKEFKGTPGPWVVRNRLTSIDVQMRGDEINDIGCLEDANLIAASPDMLFVLQKIVSYCESPEYRGVMTAKQMATFMNGVRAECMPVLAKALGETIHEE